MSAAAKSLDASSSSGPTDGTTAPSSSGNKGLSLSSSSFYTGAKKTRSASATSVGFCRPGAGAGNFGHNGNSPARFGHSYQAGFGGERTPQGGLNNPAFGGRAGGKPHYGVTSSASSRGFFDVGPSASSRGGSPTPGEFGCSASSPKSVPGSAKKPRNERCASVADFFGRETYAAIAGGTLLAQRQNEFSNTCPDGFGLAGGAPPSGFSTRVQSSPCTPKRLAGDLAGILGKSPAGRT